MGYMGFGMRKEVYTRMPRKPYVMLRKLIETELSYKKYKSQRILKDFTKEQIEEVKSKIRKDIRKANIIQGTVLSVIIILILLLCLIIVLN